MRITRGQLRRLIAEEAKRSRFEFMTLGSPRPEQYDVEIDGWEHGKWPSWNEEDATDPVKGWRSDDPTDPSGNTAYQNPHWRLVSQGIYSAGEPAREASADDPPTMPKYIARNFETEGSSGGGGPDFRRKVYLKGYADGIAGITEFDIDFDSNNFGPNPGLWRGVMTSILSKEKIASFDAKHGYKSLEATYVYSDGYWDGKESEAGIAAEKERHGRAEYEEEASAEVAAEEELTAAEEERRKEEDPLAYLQSLKERNGSSSRITYDKFRSIIKEEMQMMLREES